jgi:hypothetical protein
MRCPAHPQPSPPPARSDIDLTLTGWEEGEGELRTRWRFSAVLGLPWRPLLAAAGGTRFVFDPASGRVVQHIESWDVEPGRVVRQLLKPSAKVPATQASARGGRPVGCQDLLAAARSKTREPLTTSTDAALNPVGRFAPPAPAPMQAEVLMQALYDGDGVGAWFAVSSKVLGAALPASGLLALLHLARGEGLGWLEAAAYVGALSALLTEMYKVVKSIGGEGG